MCGITGLINFDGSSVSPLTLKKMTDAIRHRGPDGEGHWIKNNIGLGHRRLAIIDLSEYGKQPMISLDGRFIQIYNGEIYNFLEIKEKLESEGVIFKSNTDSEVVLYALATWGKKALLKFNGMFAVAFYDTKTRKLLLARDRYGVKPLYYSRQDNIFLFGSEQKAIIAHPSYKRELNKEALLEYFTFQNIFSDQTLIKDIKLLPGGYFGELDLDNGQWNQYQYWDYNFREYSDKISEEDYLEELDNLFSKAVKRQLVSDVEIGSYLSGGMDSGSITAIAAQQLPNLKTFTCGFDLTSASGIELAFDERVKAEAMSAKFKSEHYEMVLKAGDMERCLNKLAWHLEEPRVGQSYPNYYAAQLASKFVKVVLSGSGGDELFAGYPWRYYSAANSQNFESFINKYYKYWQRLVNNTEIKKMFSPVWQDVNHVWTRDIFCKVFSTHNIKLGTPEDYINHSLYFEAKTFLSGLFIVEDKLSMAHSLENRVPFMDNDLVKFAMKCPVNLKLNNLNNKVYINENESGSKKNKYYKSTKDGKQILRNMMSRYIPTSITEGKKQGFSSPDASWFKGESIDFVRSTLLDNNARIYDVIDKNTTQSLINEHLNGKKNRRLLIWSLLNINAWMELYL